MAANPQTRTTGKPASRARLLAAARSIFVDRGYHDARPQDIAREAGVGHGTFYLHFADKRDCFLAFVEEATEELDHEINSSFEGTDGFRNQIKAILTAIVRYSQDNPGVLRAAMMDTEIIARGESGQHRVSSTEQWARNWERRLSVHAREGLIDTVYDLEIIGWALIGLVREVALNITRLGFEREEIIRNLTEFIVRGLTPLDPADRADTSK